MTERSLIRLPLQFGALITALMISGFCALVSMGGIGGLAMGVAPEATFGLVENFVCPEGASLEYYSVQRSYHEPGESEPHVECVSADGTREDALLRAVLTVLGGAFLIVFAPLFIPLALLALIVPHKLVGRLRRKSAPGDVTISPIRVDAATSGRVIYQGQTYTSVDEMPSNVRRAYQQAMSVFADADGDGIPDIFESGAAIPQVDDIAQKLQKLKELYNAGLITFQEYEAKKAEILENF
jgi:hypothetical protein